MAENLVTVLARVVRGHQIGPVDVTIVTAGFERAAQTGEPAVVRCVLLHAAHQRRCQRFHQVRRVGRAEPDGPGQLADAVVTTRGFEQVQQVHVVSLP